MGCGTQSLPIPIPCSCVLPLKATTDPHGALWKLEKVTLLGMTQPQGIGG